MWNLFSLLDTKFSEAKVILSCDRSAEIQRILFSATMSTAETYPISSSSDPSICSTVHEWTSTGNVNSQEYRKTRYIGRAWWLRNLYKRHQPRLLIKNYSKIILNISKYSFSPGQNPLFVLLMSFETIGAYLEDITTLCLDHFKLSYLWYIVWLPITTIVMQMRYFIAQHIEDAPSCHYGDLSEKKNYVFDYIYRSHTR